MALTSSSVLMKQRKWQVNELIPNNMSTMCHVMNSEFLMWQNKTVTATDVLRQRHGRGGSMPLIACSLKNDRGVVGTTSMNWWPGRRQAVCGGESWLATVRGRCKMSTIRQWKHHSYPTCSDWFKPPFKTPSASLASRAELVTPRGNCDDVNNDIQEQQQLCIIIDWMTESVAVQQHLSLQVKEEVSVSMSPI